MSYKISETTLCMNKDIEFSLITLCLIKVRANNMSTNVKVITFVRPIEHRLVVTKLVNYTFIQLKL
jgi:hypothetical protein